MAKNPDAHMERNSKKLLKKLGNSGWEVARIKGSHHILKHQDYEHPVILPHPKKDLPIGLVRRIYKDLGWR